MQPKPIFPAAHRGQGYFKKGQFIWLINVNGTIEKIEIESIPKGKNFLEYRRSADDRLLSVNMIAPLILTEGEVAWTQELLKGFGKYDSPTGYAEMIIAAQAGDIGIIIYLNLLSMIERMYGSGAMYATHFFRDITAAISKAKL